MSLCSRSCALSLCRHSTGSTPATTGQSHFHTGRFALYKLVRPWWWVLVIPLKFFFFLVLKKYQIFQDTFSTAKPKYPTIYPSVLKNKTKKKTLLNTFNTFLPLMSELKPNKKIQPNPTDGCGAAEVATTSAVVVVTSSHAGGGVNTSAAAERRGAAPPAYSVATRGFIVQMCLCIS